MLNMKKGNLLRRGIAAFLLLMMIGSSFAFATEETETQVAGQTEAQAEGETSAEGQTDEEEVTIEAAAGEGENETLKAENVDVEAASSGEEEVVEEIKDDGQIVIFATGEEDVKKTVRLYYNRKIKYENFRTHDFHVKCDGESLVAYCIEPKLGLGKKRVLTAKPCSNALLSKALYYSYGNPGYNAKSDKYLDGLNLKACYQSKTGRYAFCHVMLSYIYDGQSGSGDAFSGCSSNTRTNVRKFVKAIKSWPDPPKKTELGLSAESFDAKWNEEIEMQETPEISVTGTEGNSINVPVPENVCVVKDGEIAEEGSVKVTVGESFRLRAPATVQGKYTSPDMETEMTDFQPYIIKLDRKQDQLFGINKAKTISYTVKWVDFGRVELIKTSSDPEVTEGNTYYSLEGAEYGLYSKATDKEYARLVTDEQGNAAADNIPYGEYYLKETEASRGYDIDVAVHDITVASPEQSETVLEKPIIPEITTNASVKGTGESKTTEGGTVNISDTVEYSGVEPGMEYRITGRLMSKSSGCEVDGTTEEVTFTPEKSEGSLEMDYTVNSSGLGGDTVVAFEKLYQGENLLAVHEDINNSAQSVAIVKPADKVPDTGDDTNLPAFAFAAALSVMLGLTVIRLRC